MRDTEAEKKEIKRCFQFWIKPPTLELADNICQKDNCDSRSEFIEKAVMMNVFATNNNIDLVSLERLRGLLL